MKKEVSTNLSDFKNVDQQSSSITLQDIREEVAAIQERFQGLAHREVLVALLDRVEKVDFRQRAKLQDESEAPKKKHYLVLIIEEIIRLAQANRWGLCKHHDFVYLYNGAFWSLLPTDDLKTFLSAMAEKMGIDHLEAHYYAFQDQLFKQFQASAHLPQPVRNSETVLINLRNGTYQVTPQGGQLLPFDRDDFLTYQLPFVYNPHAQAPLFETYLNRVQPDVECQHILAEYLAYIFTRHLKLEKTLLLYGTGANGKSVFFEIVNALLGRENVTNYSLQSLTNDSGYYRAKLGNALLNYASEINGRLETSIFKQLVSGEPVEARLPYGEPFTLTHYARLLFNCNDLPREVEHTNAYFRRFLIIPFEVTIPESEQDRTLASKIIRQELSGVFNWVLAGLDRLLTQGRFTESAAANRQLEIYRTQADSVLLFLQEEGFEAQTHGFYRIGKLYDDYRTFCANDGHHPVSKIKLRKRLQAKGFKVERRDIGNVVYLGKGNRKTTA